MKVFAFLINVHLNRSHLHYGHISRAAIAVYVNAKETKEAELKAIDKAESFNLEVVNIEASREIGFQDCVTPEQQHLHITATACGIASLQLYSTGKLDRN